MTAATKPSDHRCHATTPLQRVACFTISAQTDPGMLPRILAPFAKSGLVPEKVHMSRQADTEDGLLIDLQMADMDLEAASVIGANLKQTVGVRSVLVSPKFSAG